MDNNIGAILLSTKLARKSVFIADANRFKWKNDDTLYILLLHVGRSFGRDDHAALQFKLEGETKRSILNTDREYATLPTIR